MNAITSCLKFYPLSSQHFCKAFAKPAKWILFCKVLSGNPQFLLLKANTWSMIGSASEPELQRAEWDRINDVFRVRSEFNLIYFLESGVYIHREKRVECSKMVKSLLWLRQKWIIQDCNIARNLSSPPRY